MSQLDDMATFVRVAELASFTQAAQSLGLPRASVSAAVQRLESQLGTRLLHRTTRRVQLTQDGAAFAERVKDVLADVDELQSMFRPAPALRGRLRVDMPLGVAGRLVLPRLGEFLHTHPGLEIELGSTDRRVDLVREGFDCVLRIGALSDSTLVARPLGRYAMANCASAGYVRAHGRPRDLDDLAARHRLVHYAPTLGTRPPGFEVQDAPDRAPRFVPVAGALTVNNSESYMGACLAGLGIVQVPRAAAAEALAGGELVEVLPEHCAAPMPVSLLYAHRRHLPQRVQVFMNWLAALIQPQLMA